VFRDIDKGNAIANLVRFEVNIHVDAGLKLELATRTAGETFTRAAITERKGAEMRLKLVLVVEGFAKCDGARR